MIDCNTCHVNNSSADCKVAFVIITLLPRCSRNLDSFFRLQHRQLVRARLHTAVKGRAALITDQLWREG